MWRGEEPLSRSIKRRDYNARRAAGVNSNGLHYRQYSVSVVNATRIIEEAVKLRKRDRGRSNNTLITAG